MPSSNANSIIDLSFPHRWEAEILPSRPLILPPRHYVYPHDVEEVERGALEVLVRPNAAVPQASEVDDELVPPTLDPFLATCALGFRDPAVPSGIWSCPHQAELCAVAGGYAYVIDTTNPARFTMIAYRPVLEVRSVPGQRVLLFVGHRSMVAWGERGAAWESGKLSDEGITITGIESGLLRGLGWNLISDAETSFTLDLTSGKLVHPPLSS